MEEQVKQPKAAKNVASNMQILESKQYELRIVSVSQRTANNDGANVEYYMFSAIDLTTGRKLAFSISKSKAIAYGWISGVRNVDGKDVQVVGTMDNLLSSGMGEVYVTAHLTEVPEIGTYGYKDKDGMEHAYRNNTVVFDQFDGFISKESIREYESVHTSKALTTVFKDRCLEMFEVMTGHAFRPGNEDDIPVFLQIQASLK